MPTTNSVFFGFCLMSTEKQVREIAMSKNRDLSGVEEQEL